MAWVTVDGDGSECMFASEPIRIKGYKSWVVDDNKYLIDQIELPRGSIKKLIGRELSFSDEPVELKEE